MQQAIAKGAPAPDQTPAGAGAGNQPVGDDPNRDLVVAILDVVTRVRRRHGSVASLDKGAVALLSQLSESGEVRGSDLAEHVVPRRLDGQPSPARARGRRLRDPAYPTPTTAGPP